MVKTWQSEEAGDAECEKCGSVYAVTITRYPMRDQDKFNCSVCGYLMNRWNDTESPSYTLKKRGTPPDGK